MKIKFRYILVYVCMELVRQATGSAWLQDPPSRSAAWYYQIKAPVNYEFRNLDCGGVPVKIETDGSRNCGLCGDSYTDPVPRPNEIGGKYANPRIRTRYYESGQMADISLWNNLPGSPGFYEFRLCDEGLETQACFDKYLLTIVDHDTGTNRSRTPVPATQGLNIIHLQLPVGVTCDFCTLQWRFRKENSAAGCDDNNWCGVGRGPQIEYYNCADVMIGGVGQPKPDFIQDPTYSDADYGSAYDMATTRNNGSGSVTTPDGSNLGGSTTPSNVITIPTAFPTTTSRPVTTGAPTTTTTVQTPTNPRVVFDSSGNTIGTNLGGSSSSNNRPLLALLALLPLVGAITLRNNAQTLPIPPAAPYGFWAQNVPLSNMYLGTSFGFGNFGGNGFGSFGGNYAKTSSYGSSSYGSSGKTYKVLGTNNLQSQQQLLHTVVNNGNLLGNGVPNFVSNPVVWNNAGVSINQGLPNHIIYPRSTGNGYQPHNNGYGTPKSIVLPSSSTGYNDVPHSYGQPIFPNPKPQNFQQPIPWPNSNIPNTGINNVNNINTFNGAGTGQRFPVPTQLPAPAPRVFPPQNQPNNNNNPARPKPLSPLESASRFQVSGPQVRVETSQPLNSGARLFPGNGIQQTPLNSQRTSWQVHNWYQVLMSRSQPNNGMRLV